MTTAKHHHGQLLAIGIRSGETAVERVVLIVLLKGKYLPVSQLYLSVYFILYCV